MINVMRFAHFFAGDGSLIEDKQNTALWILKRAAGTSQRRIRFQGKKGWYTS
jgi:hypothetical protein